MEFFTERLGNRTEYRFLKARIFALESVVRNSRQSYPIENSRHNPLKTKRFCNNHSFEASPIYLVRYAMAKRDNETLSI